MAQRILMTLCSVFLLNLLYSFSHFFCKSLVHFMYVIILSVLLLLLPLQSVCPCVLHSFFSPGNTGVQLPMQS